MASFDLSPPPALGGPPAAARFRIGRAALVAREAERGVLERALAEARGAMRCVFVGSEPGIGKSRLLAEVAA